MATPGKIITFYSYKGGTGRSMVLANVAYILATRPPTADQKILMIDWDLEAPGLHRYFQKEWSKPKLAIPGTKRGIDRVNAATGLLEFIEDAAATYRDSAPSENLPANSAHTDRAIALYAKARADKKLPVLAVGDLGNLDLLKAGGEGDEYANRVRRFDWEGFYTKYGSFFVHFREELMREYSYVLIDSRTGLTDTSGICTRVLPETLVGVFAPNRQNIDGLVSMIRGATAYRRDSSDSRPLVMFPVASRIVTHKTLRSIWWKGGKLGSEDFAGYEKIFEDLFVELFELDSCDLEDYFNATQVPHDPDYAYGEEIDARTLAGTADKLSIGAACANLTDRLLAVRAPWESLPDAASLVSDAKREAASAYAKAETLEKSAQTARWWLRVAAVIPVLFALGYAGWQVWLTKTDAGQRYQLVQDATLLAGRENIDNAALRAWALAEVRTDQLDAAETIAIRLNNDATGLHDAIAIAVVLANAGQTDRAQALAKQVLQKIESSDSADRPIDFMVYALAQDAMKDREAALAALQRAEKALSEKKGDPTPSASQAQIVLALVREAMGLSRDPISEVPIKADATIGPMTDRRAFGGALSAWTGDVKSAANVADNYSINPVDYPILLRYVALAYINAGDDKKAEETFNLLKPFADRMLRSARSQQAPLRPERQTPSTPESTTTKEDLVVATGVRMARAYGLLANNAVGTRFAKAADDVMSTKSSNDMSPTDLQRLAEAWAAVGDFERANTAAGRITPEPQKSNALSAIAIALAKSGKPDVALLMFTPRISVELRAEALDAAATALSRAGQLQSARESAGRQSDDSRKLETYAHVLSAWIGRTDKKWADYDAQYDFMNAWQDIWWDQKSVPRIPGNKRVSTW
jgi:cellulose biosynthesis protein BcsQ/tetratricopeptide (TPR) repeat protein